MVLATILLFLINILFIYLFRAALVFVAVYRLSLVSGSRGSPLAAMHWLLFAVVSLVAEHRL